MASIDYQHLESCLVKEGSLEFGWILALPLLGPTSWWCPRYPPDKFSGKNMANPYDKSIWLCVLIYILSKEYTRDIYIILNTIIYIHINRYYRAVPLGWQMKNDSLTTLKPHAMLVKAEKNRSRSWCHAGQDKAWWSPFDSEGIGLVLYSVTGY